MSLVKRYVGPAFLQTQIIIANILEFHKAADLMDQYVAWQEERPHHAWQLNQKRAAWRTAEEVL